MKKILIIQTAFTGDVILATAVAEKLHQHYPQAQLDFMLRKGNEGLLANHPFINNVLVWDKKQGKYAHLFTLLKQIRNTQYDAVINLQRFASSGFVTAFSRAKQKIGFDKNPFSFLFTKTVKHRLDGRHEVERNLELISHLTDNQLQKPVLYPTVQDEEIVKSFVQHLNPYVVFAPASVWYTKQLPVGQWAKLITLLAPNYTIVFTGGLGDAALCHEIINLEPQYTAKCVVLAGKLNYLQSAALIKGAAMTYVNDSAPLHMASAVNAPVTAFFCSTVPQFGFTPLSDVSKIIEKREPLSCRPCGLHGYKACPQGHFKCAVDIDVSEGVI